MIYGYSERGIFNSIIYYLDSKQEEQPKLIGEFLEKLGINGFSNGKYEFTFLNEQSFSDFGDSDLTIIVKKNKTDEKPRAVVFIEGKVKTYSQNKFSLSNQFDKIDEKEQYKGISSNIFVQLYYKYLLVEKLDSENYQTESRIGKTTKKLGKNQIVKRGYEKIAKAQKYYYVAIIPKQKDDSKKITQYFEDLKLLTDVKDNIRCASWQDIEAFFVEKNAKDIMENFEYNKGQIY